MWSSASPVTLSLLAAARCCLATTFWSSSPADNWADLIRTSFPVGNGQLGLLPYGSPGVEKLNLNEASLWSGGPFENASYSGVNPQESIADRIPGIQQWIFRNGTGNATALQQDWLNYGSYAVLSNVTITIDGVSNYTSYNRSLDLSTGVHTTSFSAAGTDYTTQVYCSYPDQVCVYDITSTSSLPAVSIAFEDLLRTPFLSSPLCSSADGTASIKGLTQLDIGMTFFALARPIGIVNGLTCSASGALTLPSNSTETRATFVIAAGTDYDQKKGTAEANYSFRGEDPEQKVLDTAAAAASKAATDLSEAHLDDFTPLMARFILELPDTAASGGLELSEILARYSQTEGDPFVEKLQFDFGRYLLATSSRDGSLPPNLQGKWAYGLTNAWSADYHVDINLQMNYWGSSEVGFDDLHGPLWDYMIDTWTGRATDTAKLIYGGEGWMVHGYINTFGATGLPTGDAVWSLLTSGSPWLMLHVADHYEFTQDTEWLQSTGYPKLLKPVAQFWASTLVADHHFNDGSLVVNPCVSPELGPVTFGCTHHQQILHSLFTNILRLGPLAGEPDTTFLSKISDSLAQLDKGLHIGSWAQIQEWKLDLDVQNDTHRHLSHLLGWYPGASIASYADGYGSNTTVQDAVRNSLISRGDGIADSDAGWEKVWRAAAWARLNDSQNAYAELKLALGRNFAPNALSMYSGHNEPFQIDANFGFVGAVVSMLVVDLPSAATEYDVGQLRTVVLGPAIPSAWGDGSIKGLRLRGGAVVDFGWDMEGVVDNVQVITQGRENLRLVNVRGEELSS